MRKWIIATVLFSLLLMGAFVVYGSEKTESNTETESSGSDILVDRKSVV